VLVGYPETLQPVPNHVTALESTFTRYAISHSRLLQKAWTCLEPRPITPMIATRTLSCTENIGLIYEWMCPELINPKPDFGCCVLINCFDWRFFIVKDFMVNIFLYSGWEDFLPMLIVFKTSNSPFSPFLQRIKSAIDPSSKRICTGYKFSGRTEAHFPASVMRGKA